METGRFDNDPVPSFEALVRRYAEAVYSTDENVGRVLKLLDDAGLRDSTLVVYMGDNGFALGEHGFYDKRDAFETSIRVPLLAWAPGAINPTNRTGQVRDRSGTAAALAVLQATTSSLMSWVISAAAACAA
jgi:N-acetylglucosamine-6-sulfatase